MSLTEAGSGALWWRELGRLALDDEGYLWLMPAAGDEDTPTRKLGHVEDDPPIPGELVAGEDLKSWLAAERAAEPTRQDEMRDWDRVYRDGLP